MPITCEVCGKICKRQRKRFCSIECRSIAYTGDGNPFFGKTQSTKQNNAVRTHNKTIKDYRLISEKLKGRVITDESRAKISRKVKEWHLNNPNPMKGKKHTADTEKKISLKTREAYLKSDICEKRKFERIPYKMYYNEVWRLTEQNDLSVLENYDKRSYYGYHLDHIIPIREGFDKSIPATEIASVNNLQFLWWKDNIQKRTKIGIIPEHLKRYYETKNYQH